MIKITAKGTITFIFHKFLLYLIFYHFFYKIYNSLVEKSQLLVERIFFNTKGTLYTIVLFSLLVAFIIK